MSELKRVNQLAAWFEAGQVVVGDGAMGTMLQSVGLTDGGAPEVWNVEQPEKIGAIYQAYADAGANVITTNTFGGSLARLKFHNVGDRTYERYDWLGEWRKRLILMSNLSGSQLAEAQPWCAPIQDYLSADQAGAQFDAPCRAGVEAARAHTELAIRTLAAERD